MYKNLFARALEAQKQSSPINELSDPTCNPENAGNGSLVACEIYLCPS